MAEPLVYGQTYKEYLKEVRAKQFGWDLGEPEKIDADVAQPVTTEEVEEKPKAKKTTKKKVKEETESVD